MSAAAAPVYAPKPGTVAFRALAHLETLPPGTEMMTAALAEAIGMPAVNLGPCLEAALSHGSVFRRQRDQHVRSPYWWSLTDHSSKPRAPVLRVLVPDDAPEPVEAAPEPRKPRRKRAREDQGEVAQQAERRAHTPEVAGASPALASSPRPMRIALWSDGVLQVERSTVGGAAELVLFSHDETRQLVAYLDRLVIGEVQ